MSKTNEQVYCAFCKSKRKVFVKSHVTLSNFIETLVLSGILMWIIWESVDFRFLLIWLMLLMVSEILIIFRHRLSLACKYCGFDPVLYKRSPHRAADVVRTHLERRKSDPSVLLSGHYRLDIPYRTKDGEVVRPYAKEPGAGFSELES